MNSQDKMLPHLAELQKQAAALRRTAEINGCKIVFYGYLLAWQLNQISRHWKRPLDRAWLLAATGNSL